MNRDIMPTGQKDRIYSFANQFPFLRQITVCKYLWQLCMNGPNFVRMPSTDLFRHSPTRPPSTHRHVPLGSPVLSGAVVPRPVGGGEGGGVALGLPVPLLPLRGAGTAGVHRRAGLNRCGLLGNSQVLSVAVEPGDLLPRQGGCVCAGECPEVGDRGGGSGRRFAQVFPKGKSQHFHPVVINRADLSDEEHDDALLAAYDWHCQELEAKVGTLYVTRGED